MDVLNLCERKLMSEGLSKHKLSQSKSYAGEFNNLNCSESDPQALKIVVRAE